MNWQTITVVALLMIITLVMVNLALFSWRRREFVWTVAFALVCASISVWSFFYALELGSDTLQAKMVWAQFQYIGLAFIPLGWFLFGFGYSGRTEWLARRTVPFTQSDPSSDHFHGVF